MSSIQFLCSSCRHRLQVDESQKGKQGDLPHLRCTNDGPGCRGCSDRRVGSSSAQRCVQLWAATHRLAFPDATSGGCLSSCLSLLPSADRAVCHCELCLFRSRDFDLGIIFGHIAMNKINASGGQLGGEVLPKRALSSAMFFSG